MKKLKIIGKLKIKSTTLSILTIIILILGCKNNNKKIVKLYKSGVDFDISYNSLKNDSLLLNPHVINFNFENKNTDCFVEKIQLKNKESYTAELTIISSREGDILAAIKPKDYKLIFGDQKRKNILDDLYHKFRRFEFHSEHSKNMCEFFFVKSNNYTVMFTFNDNYVVFYEDNPNGDNITKKVIHKNNLISSTVLKHKKTDAPDSR